MEHFFEWFRRQHHPERPWLILGKGPSFGLRSRFDLTGFDLLSLNHAVREQRVRLAHMIDLDVVDACGEVLLEQAGHVVLPWYPHVHNVPGSQSLAELVPSHPLLRRLADADRLLWYDLSTAARRHGPGPVVQATYFSAEAAVGLLALAGARRVRSLGVDGGVGYSADFEDLTRETLLANGQPGFDLQFQGIARTILATGVDFAPLDLPAPMTAMVLSGEATSLPDKVLEYSIRKHASMSVRLHTIRSPADIEMALEGVRETSSSEVSATGARAIVLRSGALVLDDLRKLWARPRGREMLEVPRAPSDGAGLDTPAVIVATATDAQRLGAAALGELDTGRPPPLPLVESLPPSWTRRDRFEPGDTSLLLYSAPGLEPWISRAHPFAHLWIATLLDAVQEGFVSLDLIRTETRLGHVRPSLLEQVERRNPETLLLSWSARRRDAGFTPPTGPPPAQVGPLSDPRLILHALARSARRQVSAWRRRYLARSA